MWRITPVFSYQMGDSFLGTDPRKFELCQAPKVIPRPIRPWLHDKKRVKSQWGHEAVLKCCNGTEKFYRGTWCFNHLLMCALYTELLCTVNIGPKRPQVASTSGRRHTLLGLLFPFWSRIATRHQERLEGYMFAGIAFNEWAERNSFSSLF